MRAHLIIKTPESEADIQWLAGQSDNYAAIVVLMSDFIERRAQCGDMTTREVLDEFERNVCVYMRRAFDINGSH